MSTKIWSSPSYAGTAAAFKTVLTDLVTYLTATGFLVQTGDTGQLDPSTISAALGTTSARQGYLMFRMNDTLQATQPIFIRLDIYNGSLVSGNIALYPIFMIGVATDGAGNFVGDTTQIVPMPVSNSSAWANANNSLPSYLCVTEGFFGIAWKVGHTNASAGSSVPNASNSELIPQNNTAAVPFTAFAGGNVTTVCRTVGDDGEPDGQGFHVLGGRYVNSTNGSGGTWTVDYYEGGVCKIRSRNPVQIVGGAAGASISGAPQLSRYFGARPATKCIPQLLAYVDPNPAANDVFQVAPVGTRLRTYIALGPHVCPFEQTVYAAGGSVAMLWE